MWRNFTWFCQDHEWWLLPLSKCSLFKRDQIDRELKDPTNWHHPGLKNRLKWSKEIHSHFHEEIASFYNIFTISYLNMVPWINPRGDQVIAGTYQERSETWLMFLTVQETFPLSRRLIQKWCEYYFVADQDERVTDEKYRKFIEPSNINLNNQWSWVSISFISGLKGLAMKMELFKVIQLKSLTRRPIMKTLALAAGHASAIVPFWVLCQRQKGLLYQERATIEQKRVAWWLKPEAVVWFLEQTVPCRDDFQLEPLVRSQLYCRRRREMKRSMYRHPGSRLFLLLGLSK